MRLLHLLAAALLFAAPAFAAEQPFITARQVDLLQLLAPPPAAGSVQDRAEMDEVVAREQTRTPERVAQAQADVTETVFAMFGATLGPAFTAPALPAATALFDRLGDTEEDVVGPAKIGFARLRPYLANPALHPAAPTSRSGSYPSGHATRVTIMGVVLAAMLPEYRGPIFARMDDYAESRIVAGVHYRSDIVAGRQAGTAIDAVLFNDPAFRTAFEAARAEVRRVMGL